MKKFRTLAHTHSNSYVSPMIASKKNLINDQVNNPMIPISSSVAKIQHLPVFKSQDELSLEVAPERVLEESDVTSS